MQRVLIATGKDDEKEVFIPTADKIRGPDCVLHGAGERLQHGVARQMAEAVAEFLQIMRVKKDNAEGNVKLVECAEHFAEMRVHHGLIGQPGKFIEAAARPHSLVA